MFLYCAFKKKKNWNSLYFPLIFFSSRKKKQLASKLSSCHFKKKKDVYLLSCSGLNVFGFLFQGDKTRID